MTSTIKVDNIQKTSDDSNIIKKCGSTITIGSSGASVALACGATQTGFGRTGTVDWCTTAKTSPFTAVSGDGFFVNTTSGAITVTLPAGSAGDIVALKDYANTWDTNNVTLTPTGTDKINGVNENATLDTESQSVTLIYVDGTKGWQDIHDSTSNVTGTPNFIVATGGTETTSGDYKIHTFTGDGNFVIDTAPTPANNKVSYVVVAGGGASGSDQSGAGGAGGYREGKDSTDPYTASPLAGTPCSALTVTASTTYPITVGGGGAGKNYSAVPNTPNNGANSVFSTITSSGGGYGGTVAPAPIRAGNPGGSGGGGSEAATCNPHSGGTGNTPPVSPPQGNNGGASSNTNYGGGGGGAGEAGNTDGGGHGGDGVASSITGSPVTRAGGGSSGATPNTPAGIAGGDGGGGTGSYPNASQTPVTNGAANTGGGAGGSTGYYAPGNPGNNGGSGIVIIRYKFQ